MTIVAALCNSLHYCSIVTAWFVHSDTYACLSITQLFDVNFPEHVGCNRDTRIGANISAGGHLTKIVEMSFLFSTQHFLSPTSLYICCGS